MKTIRATLMLVALTAAVGWSSADAKVSNPYGTYRTTLRAADPDVPSGVWTLVLAPGKFTTDVSGDAQVNRGRLRVAGNVLTFTREHPVCLNDVGRYRWTLTGRTLRLRVIGKDTCSGNDRTVVLTAKPWTRVR